MVFLRFCVGFVVGRGVFYLLKFLDGGRDDAAVIVAQEPVQVPDGGSVFGILEADVDKRGSDLMVEVAAVGHDDDRGVVEAELGRA